MKIFLSGEPGSGKSTVLIKTIELLKQKGLKVGGIVTPERREKGKRIAFLVEDIYSGKEGILASVEQKTGPRLGKYRVNLESFERVALPALEFAIKQCDIIAIDEIGKMEFFSSKFKNIVYEIVKLDKPLIAVVHRNYAKEFSKFGQLITVTQENRNELSNVIFNQIIQTLKQN